MDILVRNSSELRDAFSNANGGDVIRLAPGDYGETLLRGEDFSSDVTITSADPGNRAAFDESLELSNVSNVTIEGIDIDAGSLARSGAFSRFQVVDSEDVTVRDVTVEGHIPTASEGRSPEGAGRLDAIQGVGHENGMRIRRSDDVTLEDVEFSDLRQALSIEDANGTRISDLDVHDVREGINMNDIEDIVIEDSWFHDFQRFSRDHPDMIQYWGTDTGAHNVTIRNNLLEQPEGSWTQSIFGHFNNRPDYVTGSDFTITGNTIINGHPNAIRIREIDGFEITNNIILPNQDDLDSRRLPRITVLDSDDGEVSGNYVIPRWDGSLVNLSDAELARRDIDVSGNISLSRDSGSSNYWADLLDGSRPVAAPPEEEDDEEEDVAAPPPAEPDESEAPEAPAEPDESEAPGEPEPDDSGDADGDAPAAPGRPAPAVALPSDEISGGSSGELLRDTSGDTALTGEGGADRFVFDYRRDTGPARDVVTDLDFGEGDRLIFVGNDSGTFDDGADPSNRMTVIYDGARAHIRSDADLMEAAEAGGVTLSAGRGGDSLIVTLAEAPDRSVELLNFAADEFIL